VAGRASVANGLRPHANASPVEQDRGTGALRPRSRLTLQLDFFVYSRDAADTRELRDDQELLEKHWSYMDRFAESMIARGSTLDADRENATGSLHVLACPASMQRASSLRSSRTTVQASTGSTWSGGLRTSSDAPCGFSGRVLRGRGAHWEYAAGRIYRREVQRRATSRRCQRSSVVGLTRTERQRERGSKRLAAARKI
jgi:hypothetical protein